MFQPENELVELNGVKRTKDLHCSGRVCAPFRFAWAVGTALPHGPWVHWNNLVELSCALHFTSPRFTRCKHLLGAHRLAGWHPRDVLSMAALRSFLDPNLYVLIDLHTLVRVRTPLAVHSGVWGAPGDAPAGVFPQVDDGCDDGCNEFVTL